MLQRYQFGDQPKRGLAVKEIHQGGMGIVYILEAAADPLFRVAMKSCDAERLMSQEAREQISKESLIWISLAPHPNIIKALSFEFDGGLPSLLLEYASGGNLRDRLNAVRPALTEFLRITSEFCEGMLFLSESRKIVHRDIKPENILFTGEGRLKITDFGLALTFAQPADEPDDRGRLVRTKAGVDSGVIEGTVPYMAPEQFDSPSNIDSRADIYSFGIVMYEMLSGNRPFDEGSVERFKRAHQRSTPPALHNGVPHELRGIVKKCLEKSPAARFDGFQSLARAVNDFCRLSGNEASIASHVSIKELEENLDDGDWNNRGYSFSQLGDLDEAVRCYRQGIEKVKNRADTDHYAITPGVDIRKSANIASHVNLLDNLGATLLHGARGGRASLVPGSLATLLGRCDRTSATRTVGVAEGKVKEGLSRLKRSTECEPGNFDLLMKYLRACYEAGERSEFESGLKQFLEGKKDDAPFLTATGCFVNESLGPDVALRCFDAVLQRDPDVSYAWFNKGVTL